MPAPSDKVYKYVYFGGVAPTKETSIHEVIEEMYGVEIAQANHIFLPDSRKLNLYGLEVKVVVKCCKNREISIARKEEPHYGCIKRRRNKQSLGFEQIMSEEVYTHLEQKPAQKACNLYYSIS